MKPPEGANMVRWVFNTILHRNKFIDEEFPIREADDTPGGFNLPNKNYLGVNQLEVTYYVNPDNW